jgi:hypothetical protein
MVLLFDHIYVFVYQQPCINSALEFVLAKSTLFFALLVSMSIDTFFHDFLVFSNPQACHLKKEIAFAPFMKYLGIGFRP